MKTKKDPFDLFRDNQHKLSERPSPQAWRRLERRLDAHKNRRSGSWFSSHLGMVAAIALLVVSITVISFLTNHKNEIQAAASEPVPAQLEELTASADQQEMLKVVEFSRRYQDRLAKPTVNEGQKGKKLVPSRNLN